MKMGTLYTIKYFYNSMPRWKRIKDPVLTRVFYRPLSFVFASICARCGIQANTVSYLSAIVAVFACVFFIVGQSWSDIVGAVLCNVWLLMDCVDGNLARGVKKQAFGPFADSISSYLLVGFVCTAMGLSCYAQGGRFVEAGNVWILLMGAFASSSDTMMRLIYHKYKSTERELQDNGVLEAEHDVRTDNSQTNNWRVRLESDWGIGGVLPLFILLGSIFKYLDIVVCYCLLYYGGSFIALAFLYVFKAIKAQRKYNIPY